DPDIVVPTYNGESIGRREGDTHAMNTKCFETYEHWIDSCLPISDQFEITERMKLIEGGKKLQIEYTMIDPKNWKGEWKSTKKWLRMDYSDIPEVECLPNLNKNLPSTAEGSAEVDRREKEAEKAAADKTAADKK